MASYVYKKQWKKALFATIDVCGKIAFFPSNRFRKKPTPKKILVVRLDQIGDVIQTIPFFEKLKKKYPNSLIHTLITKHSEFLLKNNPNINQIITVPSSWFYEDKKTSVFQLWSLIKKEKYDTAFDLRGDIRNIALLRLAGIKWIIGYPATGGGFFLDETRKYNREDHEIDKNLTLIDENAAEDLKFDFPIPQNDQKIASQIVGMNNRSKIVIHPFSRASARMWGINNFKKLIHKLVSNDNVTVYVIGAKDEMAFASQFKWNNNIINCIGKTSLYTSIALIKQADVFIGNNSGPQYFAAYSGIKTCVIFGYTDNYLRWQPKVKKGNFIPISIPVDCGFCELMECNNEKGHLCMQAITVDMVYDHIKQWLGTFK